MSETTPRRKRSSSLQLSAMMAGAASLSLTACDAPSGPPPGSAQWNEAQVARSEPVQAFGYTTLEACKAADEVPDAECDKGWAAAQADDSASAPRYEDRTTCEDVYGAGNCVPRGSGGGSFFTPLLTGFVIGQMLDGGGHRYYRGTSVYHRRDDGYGGGYYTGWGGRLERDYATGRYQMGRYGLEPTPAMREAPPKVQTRTAVVSRGGFGGGSRGYHSYGG